MTFFVFSFGELRSKNETQKKYKTISNEIHAMKERDSPNKFIQKMVLLDFILFEHVFLLSVVG